jgi:hypothetical protein
MPNEDKAYLIPYTLDVEGLSYILDLDAYHEAVKMPPRKVVKVVEDDKGVESEIEEMEDGGLNVSKYELLKYVLEVVMDEKGGEDIDSAMGISYGFKKMPFSFKLSFNTLLSYGIIKPLN